MLLYHLNNLQQLYNTASYRTNIYLEFVFPQAFKLLVKRLESVRYIFYNVIYLCDAKLNF